MKTLLKLLKNSRKGEIYKIHIESIGSNIYYWTDVIYNSIDNTREGNS